MGLGHQEAIVKLFFNNSCNFIHLLVLYFLLLNLTRVALPPNENSGHISGHSNVNSDSWDTLIEFEQHSWGKCKSVDYIDLVFLAQIAALWSLIRRRLDGGEEVGV